MIEWQPRRRAARHGRAAGTVLCLVAGILAVAAGRADAASLAPQVYLDARTGADTNACTAAAPCASLGRALARVAPGGVIRLAAGIYAGTTVVPAGSNVTIAGAGATTTSLHGMLAGTVLTVPATATVRLVDVTVFGGKSAGDGGGIANRGDLTLQRARVSFNNAVRGAGVFSDAGSRLTVVDSRVDTNQAGAPDQTGVGGGILFAGGTLSVSGSTVDDNTVLAGGRGAGLTVADSVTASITNSTITRNLGAERGGGIESGGAQLTLRHVTITANSGRTAGNFFMGWTTVLASVIADNTGQNCVRYMYADNGSAYDVATDDTCQFLRSSTVTAPANVTGTLQDNGGSTPTHLLPYDSAARGAVPIGSGLCEGTDQRGRPWRSPGASGCDAGAVQSPPDLQPSAAELDFGMHGVGEHATATATVTNAGPAAVRLGTVTATAGYQVTGRCDTDAVAPGQSCALQLQLTTVLGPSEGTLNVDYYDAETRHTVTISLDGAGTDVPVNVTPPAITAEPHPGVTVAADPGRWAGLQPMDLRYEWWRCDNDGADNCTELLGTEATYTPTDADLYWQLRLKVIAGNAAGVRAADGTGRIVTA
ncbi:choice-of-anchor D domain-containing protein [Dactylosporangium sp. McL0621]|uniref:choice-of-anchor D domain-containing protein n=1 Tax=Dactylosporangium sp. McL0621 TaxID=3415678 RepID=UPI003CF32AC1